MALPGRHFPEKSAPPAPGRVPTEFVAMHPDISLSLLENRKKRMRTKKIFYA